MRRIIALIIPLLGAIGGYGQSELVSPRLQDEKMDSSYVVALEKGELKDVPLALSNPKLRLYYRETDYREREVVIGIRSGSDAYVFKKKGMVAYGDNYIDFDISYLFTAYLGVPLTIDLLAGDNIIAGAKVLLVEPPEMEEPVGQIEIQVLEADCKVPGNNTILLFGTVNGGKAPYKLEWNIYDLDKSGRKVIQPVRTILASSEEVDQLEVRAVPNYIAVLKSIDACGEKGETAIQVQCNKEKGKEYQVQMEIFDHIDEIKQRGDI